MLALNRLTIKHQRVFPLETAPTAQLEELQQLIRRKLLLRVYTCGLVLSKVNGALRETGDPSVLLYKSGNSIAFSELAAHMIPEAQLSHPLSEYFDDGEDANVPGSNALIHVLVKMPHLRRSAARMFSWPSCRAHAHHQVLETKMTPLEDLAGAARARMNDSKL